MKSKKLITLLLAFIFIGWSEMGKAQSASVCDSAKLFQSSNPYFSLNESLVNGITWYKFSLDFSDKIEVAFIEHHLISSNMIGKVTLYNGNCNSLNELTNDSISYSNDSILILRTPVLDSGAVYYVKLEKTTFNINELKFMTFFEKSNNTLCLGPVPSCPEYITNGDFESFIPGFSGTTCFDWSNKLCSWNSGTNNYNMYYFHQGFTYNTGMCCNGDVPTNSKGTQPDHSAGVSYAGIWALTTPAAGYNQGGDGYSSSYFSEQLQTPLTAGATYKINFM